MSSFLDSEFATRLLKKPGPLDNKYTRGSVGFVTGSRQYPGAALLGISAAFEVQIGIVEYLGPEALANLVISNRPEVIPGIRKAKALVVGSGVSPSDEAQLAYVQSALTLGLPMVIDAQALQVASFGSLTGPFLATPHAKEAERLFHRFGIERTATEIAANPLANAQELADLVGGTVLLKGSISVIAGPGFHAVEVGPLSPHLATAGTGDVLAGLIAALFAKQIAQEGHLTPTQIRDCAIIGNLLLSGAAELAAQLGEFGASEIVKNISEVIRCR